MKERYTKEYQERGGHKERKKRLKNKIDRDRERERGGRERRKRGVIKRDK